MSFHFVYINVVIFTYLVQFSIEDTVSTASACSKYFPIRKYYAQGCSGLTAELLGKKFKTTSKYRQGASIGSNNKYTGVSPGELVGFPGHVAIYIGNSGCQCKFIDVPGPAENVRCVKNGYGGQTIYKYYY